MAEKTQIYTIINLEAITWRIQYESNFPSFSASRTCLHSLDHGPIHVSLQPLVSTGAPPTSHLTLSSPLLRMLVVILGLLGQSRVTSSLQDHNLITSVLFCHVGNNTARKQNKTIEVQKVELLQSNGHLCEAVILFTIIPKTFSLLEWFLLVELDSLFPGIISDQSVECIRCLDRVYQIALVVV